MKFQAKLPTPFLMNALMGSVAHASDGELLSRYSQRKDQEAFAVLVRRHGPLVMSVARRSLGEVDMADDVFQATFLVLARNASKLAQSTSVAGWLFKVAVRLAHQARSKVFRRVRHEAHAAFLRPDAIHDSIQEASTREVGTLLDEAIAELQPCYRDAFLLCHIQGRSRHEASRVLGCAPGTLSGRLARAKRLLQHKLTKRGVMPLAMGIAMTSSVSAQRISPSLEQLVNEAAVHAQPTKGAVTLLVQTTPAWFLGLKGKHLAVFVLLLAALLGTIPVFIRQSEPSPTEAAHSQDQPPAPVAGNSPATSRRLPTVPFSIAGVIRNSAGKPVPQAKVYLLGAYLHAETTADAEGKYRFEKVNVPLINQTLFRDNPSTLALPGDFSILQVASKAPGLPFAWSPEFGVKPEARPATDNKPFVRLFYQGERAEMDVTSLEPRLIAGRLLDENGTPVAGAEISIISCATLRGSGDGLPHYTHDFEMLSQGPAEWSHFVTDDMGKFSATGLPADKLFWFRVRHPALPEYTFWSHTAVGALPEVIPTFESEMREGQQPVFFKSSADLKLHRARVVSVTIRSQATGELVSGVRIGMTDAAKPKSYGMDAWGYTAYGTSDQSGQVDLRVPPGEFRWYADPMNDSSMVRTSGVMKVSGTPLIQRQEIKVQDGARVKFSVIDAATGKGIPDCTFMMQLRNPEQWSMVSASTTWIDGNKDKTQADGTMLAVMAAKTSTFRVNYNSNDYVSPGPITVTLKAGETVEVKFVLKRK